MPLPSNADIPLILSRLTPNAEWGFLGEDKSDVANLDWRDRNIAQPTESEMESEWSAIENERTTKGADQTTLDQMKSRLTSSTNTRLLRAIILVLLDEINTLRSNLSLQERTKGQVRTAIENKIEDLESTNL